MRLIIVVLVIVLRFACFIISTFTFNKNHCVWLGGTCFAACARPTIIDGTIEIHADLASELIPKLFINRCITVFPVEVRYIDFKVAGGAGAG